MTDGKGRVGLVRKYGTPALVLALGAISAELITGFFTGAGLDLRNIGVNLGNRINPTAIEEIKMPTKHPGGKASCDQERSVELKKADSALSKADASIEKCLTDARKSWVKKWAPERYCENDARVKRALEAGREAWRTWKC